jgi:hypothetical protein
MCNRVRQYELGDEVFFMLTHYQDGEPVNIEEREGIIQEISYKNSINIPKYKIFIPGYGHYFWVTGEQLILKKQKIRQQILQKLLQ